LIAPPHAIEPSFGPGSFARHAALGAAAGVVVRVAQAPSLALDVDTPGDLAALREALAALPAAAPRTRALLDSMAPSSAVA
jgi:2-phospho-L-lactate guanylyltransferase